MSNAGYGNHEAAPPVADRPGAEKDGAPKSDGGTAKTGAALPGTGHRDEATPGEGAGPKENAGGDVDPGTG
jgi:hypothetical protein